MGFRTKDKVDAGSKAPNFTLPSQTGDKVSLDDFLGQMGLGLTRFRGPIRVE